MLRQTESITYPAFRRPPAPMLPLPLWSEGTAWAGLMLLDTAVVIIGVWTYYLAPLPGPYPFIWPFRVLEVQPLPPLAGVMTFLSIGVTPLAALLLLFHSIWRCVLPTGPHPMLKLFSGAFCAMVGICFLVTIILYVLREPDVINWLKESLATVVHLLIAGRGLWLVNEVRGVVSPVTQAAAFVASFLWLVLVTVPQHPWLEVWLSAFEEIFQARS